MHIHIVMQASQVDQSAILQLNILSEQELELSRKL